MGKQGRTGGFTLTEAMVVVAVVAILVAIAYPSYLDQMRKSKRAEGKGLLLETAQALEKCRTLYGAYNATAAGGANLCATVTNITGTNSISSAEGFYLVSASAGPATSTFTLQAVPQQTDPLCGTLTLDQAGTRGEGGTGTIGQCW